MFGEEFRLLGFFYDFFFVVIYVENYAVFFIGGRNLLSFGIGYF